MSKDMQLEVVAWKAGGLNFPCHYMASRFISLHCVGLHCMYTETVGDIEGYLMPGVASPVTDSDSHSGTSQQWQKWESEKYIR